jgi:hypothetical protein
MGPLSSNAKSLLGKTSRLIGREFFAITAIVIGSQIARAGRVASRRG